MPEHGGIIDDDQPRLIIIQNHPAITQSIYATSYACGKYVYEYEYMFIVYVETYNIHIHTHITRIRSSR